MTIFPDSRFPEITIKVRPSVTAHVRLDVIDTGLASPLRASLSLTPINARALALALNELADELES